MWFNEQGLREPWVMSGGPQSFRQENNTTTSEKLTAQNLLSCFLVKNRKNCRYQMSYYKAKMHQIRFRPELRPRPRWGAYSTP